MSPASGRYAWAAAVLVLGIVSPLPAVAQEADRPARPQTPRPPLPYAVEEVTVEGGVDLACTVTAPAEGGSRPGAVLLTVAGPNDRDQSHVGHRPYAVLADHLTRAGVVVLRCDDRGVGGSGGSIYAADFVDLADDALAGVDYLRGRPGVDDGAVGIIGNSEGAAVGSLAAARSPAVAWLVLLGGPGVRGSEVIRRRRQTQLEAGGAAPAEIRDALAPFDRMVDLVETAGGVGLEGARADSPETVRALDRVLDEAGVASDPFLPSDPEARLELLLSPWYHAQLTFDAPAVLREVGVPVLALTGSLDRVNLPGQNLPAIQEALLVGGNPDHTVALLPSLNHVFQTAERGGPREYARLSESFAPLALRTISHWVLLRFGSFGSEAASRDPGDTPSGASRGSGSTR